MSGVIEKIQKRRKWPVDLGDGEKVYIRAMTKREKLELDQIRAGENATPEERTKAADQRGYFIIGTIQLNEDGTLVFHREPGVSATDFAAQVEAKLLDVPEDNIALILQAWAKAENTPSLEKLVKN